MRRFLTRVLSAGLLASALPTSLLAADWDPAKFMPIDEVHPGQRGIGLTVFQGTRPDTFEIEILAVLRNIAPGRDQILARAKGEYLERTGIIAGMSGSPVFIDGRLIGAAAYAWTFATEPIVGITPIGEMLRITDRGEGPRLGSGEAEPWRFAQSAGTGATASEARPIQTPVMMSGIPPAARAAWDEFFGSLGLMGVEGGGLSPEDAEFDLRPGSAVGVPLIRGDATTMAVGTATWVDGDRILAFGHAFLQAGDVTLPFSLAYIHAVMPNQVASFKIGAPGPEVGALRADCQAGVLAVRGAEVPMIPVRVSVESDADGHRDEFRFEVARSEILTPSLVGLVGYTSLMASQKQVGESTLNVRARIGLEGRDPVETEVAVTSAAPPLTVAEQAGLPVQLVMLNPYEKVNVDSVDLEVRVVDRFRAAEIVDLRADRSDVRPGESLDLWVTLRPYREAVVVRRATLQVPLDAPPGEVEILASAAAELYAKESERAPLRFAPTDFEQLLDLLRLERSTTKVYVQGFRKAPGRVIDGREMPALPGSVLSVLNSGARSGAIGPSEGAVLMEGALDTEWVLTGLRSVTVRVLPR